MSVEIQRRTFLRGTGVLGLGTVGAGVIGTGTAWAANSQNGWPAAQDLNRNRNFNIYGTQFVGGVAWGAPEVILGFIGREFVSNVEPLVNPGCWGFAYKSLAGGVLSNHSSATALDFNAPRHGDGRRGTFTAGQVAAIRRILNYCGPAVRWGGDYTGSEVDEMHFELNRPPGAEVDALVRKIRRTSIAIWRPNEARFHLPDAYDGIARWNWGEPGDLPVTGDWNGDGRSDLGVWRPSEGRFHLRNWNGSVTHISLGANGDVPVTGDWDGNGITDVGVWRPSEGKFYLRLGNGAVSQWPWGQNGDLPVTGDWTGDGTTDLGIWRPGEGRFHLRLPNGQPTYWALGQAGDIPVTGDWNGDGTTDLGVWRPSEARFLLRQPNGQVVSQPWGQTGDRPVTGRFSG